MSLFIYVLDFLCVCHSRAMGLPLGGLFCVEPTVKKNHPLLVHYMQSIAHYDREWGEAASKNPGRAIKRFKYLGGEYH